MHNLSETIKILENNFQDYLSDIVYIPEKKEWYNNIYHVRYNHDETLSTKEEFCERYKKRIENFYHVISDYDNLIFIYHALPDDSKSNVLKLLHLLTQLAGNKNFHLIVISEKWKKLPLSQNMSLCYAPYPTKDYCWWSDTYDFKRVRYEKKVITKIFKIIQRTVLKKGKMKSIIRFLRDFIPIKKIRKIPVVFAFDDNYALPASIAIQSLLDSKKAATNYEIIVFHGGLQPETIQKLEKVCPIRWIKVDKTKLDKAPYSWNWPLSVYYRLFIADLLPEYDKVIWSDVDVLFKGDLSRIYKKNLKGADWGGVIAEKQDEKNGVHPHYPENKKPYIYMSGFMVINAKQWRQKKMWDRFMEIIKTYGERLRFFDLDILNLAADKIYPVPFDYCVLENIWEDMEKAPEYPWLVRAQGKDALLHAKKHPIIIHYAGRNPKIWKRPKDEIPAYYLAYMEKSPFCCEDNSDSISKNRGDD